MARLTDEQIATSLDGSAWHRDGDALVRDWTLKDFSGAMAFANRVATVAEAVDHHPDILIHGWNKVRLTLSTHSEGGITSMDVALAGRIDALG